MMLSGPATASSGWEPFSLVRIRRSVAAGSPALMLSVRLQDRKVRKDEYI
jgi:hypothetical protein